MRSFVLFLITLAVVSARVIPTVQAPEDSYDSRVGVRASIGQQLISAAMLSVVEPVVYLLDQYQGYLPSINDTERLGLIDVHLTTNQTRLYNLTVASVYAVWIEEHNSIKVNLGGISGNLDTLYSYHYWSVWTHRGHGSIEAYFYDASGWIEIQFGVDGDGHLLLTFLDSHIQLKHLDLKFTGSWSFILNHVPGINVIIKRRINKKFKEICRFSVKKCDQFFAKMPLGLKIPFIFDDSISFSYAIPENPAVLNSGFGSFPLMGNFFPTKYPTLYPPFNVSPPLPLTVATLSSSSSLPSFPFSSSFKGVDPLTFSYPLPEGVDVQDQGQILISSYTMTSLGWALDYLGALNFNITQDNIPNGLPIVMNTDYFSPVLPPLFASCPNCPVKWVIESPGYPIITVNSTAGVSLAYTTHMSWFTYSRKDVWEFAFSMFVDVSGSLMITVNDDVDRIYGEFSVGKIVMRNDQSDIGTVHLAPLDSLCNRVVEDGFVPIINSFLQNIGIPLPPLPLGIQMVDPEIVYGNDILVVETNLRFPFPRGVAEKEGWGEEWVEYQKEVEREGGEEEGEGGEEGEEELVVRVEVEGDGREY